VSEDCEGATVPLDATGFRTIVSEVTDITLVLITNVFMTGAGRMSQNILKSANALRCAIMSGAENVWYLLAGAYYASLTLGGTEEIVVRLDYYYPMICSCTEEFAQTREMSGVDSDVVAIFESCSEGLTLANYFDEQFDVYVENFDLDYEDRDEYDSRMAAFRDSSEAMWEHNARYEEGEETFGMSWNNFSDYTEDMWMDRLQTHHLANDHTLMLTEEPPTM
jgi:hypothetical protein